MLYRTTTKPVQFLYTNFRNRKFYTEEIWPKIAGYGFKLRHSNSKLTIAPLKRMYRNDELWDGPANFVYLTNRQIAVFGNFIIGEKKSTHERFLFFLAKVTLGLGKFTVTIVFWFLILIQLQLCIRDVVDARKVVANVRAVSRKTNFGYVKIYGSEGHPEGNRLLVWMRVYVGEMSIE